MGKETDSVGACLTCWLKDGGQRVGMALPRVIPQALEVYQEAPASSRDISAVVMEPHTRFRPYRSNEALQKLLHIIGHAGKRMFEITNQPHKVVETLPFEVNVGANWENRFPPMGNTLT
jgi:hypothetical protein